MKKTTHRFVFGALGIVFLALIILSVGFALTQGQADIRVSEVYQILLYKLSNGHLGNVEQLSLADQNIVWFVRAPRTLLAIFVGMGLAISGAVMQAVVQNPLADPYILGISSGSSLGATFAILVGFGGGALVFQFGLAFGAFIGAIFASIFVLLLASVGSKMTSTKLVLSGMIISSLCNALSNLIIYLANNAEGMKTVTFWTMGSLASASWQKLPLISLVVCVLTYMILAALLTSIIVANSGMIGFVGLIIPHIVRGMTGSDHRLLMPLSALSGSLFMIWADVLARSILKGVELPIGIITAIIGSPIFIYIILKKQYNFGG